MDPDTQVDASASVKPSSAPVSSPSWVAPNSSSAAERIDALHAKHFVGSPLGWHTSLWNLVQAFKEDVKALVASLEKDL